ncbi:hypothetical protein PG985_001575 [Apiospora marii]|uniref:uncharacterized protein n=1 Tax=Apiospora marii TaxID=335849 RepID=UPI00312F4CF2
MEPTPDMRDGLPALEGWLERWPSLSEADSQLLDNYAYVFPEHRKTHKPTPGIELAVMRARSDQRYTQLDEFRKLLAAGDTVPWGDAERRLVADDIRHGRLYEAEERMADAYECMSRAFLGIPDRVDKVDGDIARFK